MSQFTGLLSATGLGSMAVVTPVDVTPNAVDWPSSPPNYSTPTVVTIGQQITGIANSITLKLNFDNPVMYYISYGTNTSNTEPSSWTTLHSGGNFSGDTTTFTVSNNDWLFFYMFMDYNLPYCSPVTISVINVSDGNAVLDTFTYKLAARGSSCP